MMGGGGQLEDVCLRDFAYELHRRLAGDSARLPDSFVTASQLTPLQHLAAQALVQEYIDGSISKKINCRENLPYA